MAFGVRKVTPFVGGGIGYYSYFYTEPRVEEQVRCPMGYEDYICFKLGTKHKDIAEGWRPHFLTGVYIPLGKTLGYSDDEDSLSKKCRWMIVVQYRYHFLNFDPERDIDLSESQISIGIGWMWKQKGKRDGIP